MQYFLKDDEITALCYFDCCDLLTKAPDLRIQSCSKVNDTFCNLINIKVFRCKRAICMKCSWWEKLLFKQVKSNFKTRPHIEGYIGCKKNMECTRKNDYRHFVSIIYIYILTCALFVDQTTSKRQSIYIPHIKIKSVVAYL